MKLAWKPPAARGLGWLLILTPILCSAQVEVAVSAPAVVKALAEGASLEDSGNPVEGPVLGYIFDRQTQLLWRLLGIAGASQMAPAFPFEVHLGRLEVSSQPKYGFGFESGTGEAHLYDLSGAELVEIETSGLDSGIDRIVLSPSGEAAGLYNRQTKQVQIVTGLPDDPQARGRASVETVPGVLAALAISDDGESVLAGVSAEGGGSVYLVGPQQSPRSILPVGRPSSIAFLHGSSDAVVADYDRNEVLLVRDVRGAAQATVLGGERESILRPVAVAASADNERVFAASSQTNQVVILPANGDSPNLVTCECQPSRLKALAGNAVFRITGASASPVMLLDADHESNGQPAPRIVFVPPGDALMAPSPAPAPPRLPRGRALR